MIKNILIWLWQFPQNIIGFILSRFALNFKKDANGRDVYIMRHLFHSAVSLGQYILMDEVYLSWSSFEIIKRHEYGHSQQSKIFGPFYLLIVGIPSFCRNIFDRVFHKNWRGDLRRKWYYSSFPENDADKRGGVAR